MIAYFLTLLVLLLVYSLLRPYMTVLWSTNPNVKVLFYPIGTYRKKLQEDFKRFGDCLHHLSEVNPYNVQKLVKTNPLLEIIITSVGLKRFVISTNQTLIDRIMMNHTEDLHKAGMVAFVEHLALKGIVFTNGAHWKKQRKICSEFFNFNRLKTQIPSLVAISQGVVDLLEKDPEIVDRIGLYKYAEKVSGEVIVQTFFGKSFENIKIMGESMCEFSTKLIADVASQGFKFSTLFRRSLLGKFYYYFLTPYERDIKKRCEIMNKIIMDRINERYQSLESGRLNEKGYQDFVDLYLEAMKAEEQNTSIPKEMRIDLVEIYQQFLTFLIAGTDTSSHFIVNLIVLLSEYPSYQDKLVAEFDQVMGGKNPLEITLEDIRSMGQLDAFINEALRFRSPVRGLLPRKAVKDFPLSTETVKKGDILTCQFKASTLNAQYFENPNEFIPERWQKEIPSSVKADPYVFCPFSAGPRNCIGQHLALFETKVTLLLLLKKFHLVKTPKKTAYVIRFLHELEDDRGQIQFIRR